MKPKGRKPTHCIHCGKLPDWRGLQAHHLVHRSQGGKETEWWCAPCHFGEDGHRIENMPKSKPVDRTFRLSGYTTTLMACPKSAQTGIKKGNEYTT